MATNWRVLTVDIMNMAYFKFLIEFLTWIVLGTLITLRVATYDWSDSFVYCYLIYHYYAWASLFLMIFWLSEPSYWKRKIEDNRVVANGDVRCDIFVFFYLITFMGGYSGIVNYY